ncbi:MAG TPA: GNAT family N-acetyltransferase [Ramlibacter sp.]|uniref:GNAT family N-acetyltransferase n=1 Tax=Ramlibacter sp. TaxID=1917967 RepID=UPI002ED594BD
MTPLLRHPHVGDAPAIVELLAQLGYPGAEAFIERRLRELDEHPDALLRVAEADGVVLGVISLHFLPQLALPRDFCRIAYLCVAEGARGLGIGARLEAWAEAQARLRDCDRIELHSGVRRVDAHRFYARIGYAESPKYLVKSLA